jgi:hypothetical protein
MGSFLGPELTILVKIFEINLVILSFQTYILDDSGTYLVIFF